MHLRPLLGWGIVIYAVLHLVWSGFVAYGLSANILAHIAMIATLVVLAVIATRSLRLLSERDVIPYAIGWALIAMVLDAVVIVPLSGWVVFSDLNVWVGYGLLLAVPFVVTAVTRRSSAL
ncbi:MAG: hypothetical protein KBD06_02760 [Candidatus Pacebacteria bacterium]|nr:hypothetical protein [Candidatus Paceibacterota bacterium]